MKLFGPLYDYCRKLAAHRHAPWYLGFISAIESIFFPVPTDVMLAPMALAKPRDWWRLGLLATLTSVLGGVIGYALGYFAIEAVMPWIVRVGYDDTYAQVQGLFLEYGVWIMFVAAFTPIPFKVFTVAGGAAAMPLLPFVLASLIGRGLRFFLVAWVVAWGGPKVEPVFRRYIEIVGWVIAVLILGAIVWLNMRG
ncbi:MAG TPA: YqaA family protein [Arenimonas sp.]|nr:YqaA family protein [Arenimonas sp.]